MLSAAEFSGNDFRFGRIRIIFIFGARKNFQILRFCLHTCGMRLVSDLRTRRWSLCCALLCKQGLTLLNGGDRRFRWVSKLRQTFQSQYNCSAVQVRVNIVKNTIIRLLPCLTTVNPVYGSVKRFVQAKVNICQRLEESVKDKEIWPASPRMA